jgi:hypothetical protein
VPKARQKRRAICFALFFILQAFWGSYLLSADKQGTLEFIYGRFTPNDARFKAVYQKGGAIQGLILSSYLVSNFNFYLELKGFSRTGELTFSKEKTQFVLVPLTLGVRYILPTEFLLPYAGVGTDFYFYYEDNPIGTVLNYAHGYHIQAGSYVRASRSFPLRLNVKLKYTKARAEVNNRQLELGGLEFGIGLALVF